MSLLQLFITNRIRYRFTPAHFSPKLHTDLKGDYNIRRSECGEKEKNCSTHNSFSVSLTHTMRSSFSTTAICCCYKNPQLAADVKEIAKWWFHVFLFNSALEIARFGADRKVLHSPTIANSLLTRKTRPLNWQAEFSIRGDMLNNSFYDIIFSLKTKFSISFVMLEKKSQAITTFNCLWFICVLFVSNSLSLWSSL